MKIAIFRDAPETTKRLIAAQFPGDWQIVIATADEITNGVSEVDVIIPEHTVIDERLLEQAKKLKFIQTGAGYDNIDIEACSQRGIYVANAAGINARAVAEQVFALILCWTKNVINLDGALKKGEYDVDCTGSELSEKVIGIVGLGRIGREVARLALAFRMNVLVYHYRHVEKPPDIEMVDLQSLLGRSDIISLHVALNPQTRAMIGKPEFARMRSHVFFINTSRGAVVDEAALIDALRQKQIGGAGLDVFETEPLPADSPLRQLGNVILSPHRAGEPDGLFFHKKRFQFFAENIARVFSGRPPQNALNRPGGRNIAPHHLIAPVILPEGYSGKILLASVSADAIAKTVILRSGDLWHREILRNTETEIRNLGLPGAQVHELGGARVDFEPDGTIRVFGSSQQFGACDKEYAAELIRKAFPGRTVAVKD